MKEEIHDFGFSFETESDIKRQEKEALSRKESELSEVQRKLIGLRDMFLPFLESLKKDPHKDYIKWPNRGAKIDEFITSINEYIREA